MSMSTAAWTLLSWASFNGGESTAWRSAEAARSQAGGFPRSAQREEKGGIKLAKSKYFKNSFKGAVFILVRNKNVELGGFKNFCSLLPSSEEPGSVWTNESWCWRACSNAGNLPSSRQSFGGGGF